jgi:hypothetical protein
MVLFNRRPREDTVEVIVLELVLLLEHVRGDDNDDDETTLTTDVVVVEDTNADCDAVSVPASGGADDDCDWTVMV